MWFSAFRPERPTPDSSTPDSMRECYVGIVLGSPPGGGDAVSGRPGTEPRLPAAPPEDCSSSGLLRHGTGGGGHDRHGGRVRGDGLSGHAVSWRSGNRGCRCRPTGCRRCDSTRGGCRRGCRSCPRVSPDPSRSGLPPTDCHDACRRPALSSIPWTLGAPVSDSAQNATGEPARGCLMSAAVANPLAAGNPPHERKQGFALDPPHRPMSGGAPASASAPAGRASFASHSASPAFAPSAATGQWNSGTVAQWNIGSE
jgi:hypothetical protein